MKNLKFIITFLLLLVLGVGESWGYYTTCKIKIVVDNTVTPEAGEVFISTTETNDIVWQNSDDYVFKIDPSPTIYKFYCYVKPASGYRFVKWANGTSGKNAPSDTVNTSSATENPLVVSKDISKAVSNTNKIYYAILEKTAEEAEPADLGDGVAFRELGGTTEYVQGSTAGDWKVRVYFQEPLAFKDSYEASTGYGVNNDLVKFVKYYTSEDNKNKVNDVKVGASATGDGSDSYGTISLPNTLTPGTYTIHLPYGLFTTKSGKVTSACDVQVSVIGDSEPLNLASTSPKENDIWNADPEDEDNNGESINITLTFDKILSTVNTNGKTITLTNTTTGRNFTYEFCKVNIINKKQGVISYGKLPNGVYTFSLPADVFVSANGKGNSPVNISFSVKGSTAAAWELPTYNQTTINPSNNSKVSDISQIEIALSREGFTAPVEIKSNAEVTAVRTWEIYKEGVDYNDPDNKPEIKSENITGFGVSLVDGKIVISRNTPYTTEGRVTISIPAGIVTNVAGGFSMTDEALYKQNGCTNADIQITLNVVAPVIAKGDVDGDGKVDVDDVTELVDIILGKKTKNERSDINNDNNVDVSDVTELVNIILSK